jgi:hypothetical protein
VIRYEVLEPERDADGALVANRGLLALPEPADGDLFFDIEGARYYCENGREFGLQYLFGVVDTAEVDEAGLIDLCRRRHRSTRRGSCRWPTCWRWPGRPGTWSCWATRSSSPSRATPRTRPERAPPRLSTSWATTPRCRRPPACCSTRPTGCTRTCAGTQHATAPEAEPWRPTVTDVDAIAAIRHQCQKYACN